MSNEVRLFQIGDVLIHLSAHHITFTVTDVDGVYYGKCTLISNDSLTTFPFQYVEENFRLLTPLEKALS